MDSSIYSRMSGVKEIIAVTVQAKGAPWIKPAGLKKDDVSISCQCVTNHPKIQWHTAQNNYFSWINGVHFIKAMQCWHWQGLFLCLWVNWDLCSIYLWPSRDGTMSYSWQRQKTNRVNRSKHVLLKTGDRSSALVPVLILLTRVNQKTKLSAGESQSINSERIWIDRTMNNWGHHWRQYSTHS